MKEDRVEFYAATVEEALEKAASQLGVDASQLSYAVIDSGSAGFMGIGARDARVSVETAEDHEASSRPTHSEEMETPSTLEEYEGNLEEEASDHTPVPTDVLDEVRSFMESTLGGMGIDAHVDAYDAGDFVAVDVSTDQAGLFIGQKGETIDALQYLASISVFKHRDSWKRLVLDSEGYRQRRVEAVQGIAHRMARRAIREKRPIQLPPMNASERRVVHVYLKENEQISTFSEGAGENRRVTVSPA